MKKPTNFLLRLEKLLPAKVEPAFNSKSVLLFNPKQNCWHYEDREYNAEMKERDISNSWYNISETHVSEFLLALFTSMMDEKYSIDSNKTGRVSFKIIKQEWEDFVFWVAWLNACKIINVKNFELVQVDKFSNFFNEIKTHEKTT